MNPVVGAAASKHESRLLRRIVPTVVGIILFGVVAITGGLAGLGVASINLASADSAATLTAGSSTFVVPSGGADLSVAQIGTLAEGAGFSGQGLVMAIAVALAESGGNPTATNYDSNGTVDRGVWQINSVHTEYSASCGYDPTCNASAAFSISAAGTNWGAWVTYQHGTEIPFLPVAVAFASGAGAPS